MSPQKYATPLQITLTPSRRLAILFALMVFGALFLPFTVPLHWLLRLLIVAGIATITYSSYKSHFGARRIVGLLWDEEGEWKLTCADGTEHRGTLRGDSVIASGVMLLNYNVGSRVISTVLFPDVSDGETLRRLRVRLQLEGTRLLRDEKTSDKADPKNAE
jgi:hypothetical protein